MNTPPTGRQKIFGVGLSRTGTTSLTKALEMLGFSAVHFPTSPQQILDHDAATDTSVSIRFKQLDREFPGSKFVYTTRELKGWLASCEKFWPKMQKIFDGNPFITNLHQHLYGGTDFDDDRFAESYRQYEDRLLGHFAGRPDDFLSVDICGGKDGWQALCPFLGVPIPAAPFPSSNSARGFDRFLIRLLYVIADVEKVAEIGSLPAAYIKSLRGSPEFHTHDPKKILTYDEGARLD